MPDVKQTSRPEIDAIKVTPSSGNVFADLDIPDPELALAKAKISIKIEQLIQERGLTQAQAAKLMGLTPVDVSDLIRRLFDGLTLDCFFHCLHMLDQEVEVTIRPKPFSEAVSHIS